MSLCSHTNNGSIIIRGLVPVTFRMDRMTRRPGHFQVVVPAQYDDYVWLEFRRSDGLAPEAVLQAVADTLTSVLQDMRNLEVPQEMALKHLGLRVVIVRGLQEDPREVDLMATFAAATSTTTSGNARLADWVQWGILQNDPAKFRFVVSPITPADKASSQDQ
ncbi:hypothetical protein PG985_008095 [Apiospora marii]|uniref:Uncharacterized protein n=1 Tax=Apiospora marii TaxID=335849 RepID=A0ABR1R9K6_9PEZI